MLSGNTDESHMVSYIASPTEVTNPFHSGKSKSSTWNSFMPNMTPTTPLYSLLLPQATKTQILFLWDRYIAISYFDLLYIP
ncbi:hypothetical protein VN97_g1109 [Penicillium thymicola]|uniref:Uncharacterized protein n=1 Tax=Penicillium thymicola TaxID=293382 RepID=A0AAI9TSS4_PENTH|nr:hypothetical protein VN97_g1109 [Penicillium thymicola]